MKKWLSENLGFVFLFLVVVIVGFTVMILVQKVVLENDELEAQLLEQQENYEKTLEDYYYTLDTVENELKKQQGLYAELTEDYYTLVTKKVILEDKLAQAKEDAKGIYTEKDIRYAIDIFTTYLVEYPPNGTVCVYENETLFVFKIVNGELILDELLSYNDLTELWFNK